ncbi:TolC family protein [Rhizosphaericola mali]|uniref:TolC family protein n=1 Tax=Rhizosphaericola mali TaxID=2545455 RepID=A0A5P2G5P1_9BACT|nr:TolC family protein [Rhizosphaericola mali]QES89080.1 TolC family protein [Rhizosphaericola mali]
MYKKIIVSAFIFLMSFVQLKAQDSLMKNHIYSLDNCIDIAIKNNPDVTTKSYLASSSKIGLEQAKSNVFPSLNAYLGHSLYNGRSINIYTNSYVNQSFNSGNYNVTTSLTLWNGSSIQNYIKKCALDYKASELELQQAKDNLTFQIILDYLSVLASNEQLIIAKSQVETTLEQLRTMQVKFDNGVVGMGDLSDIKGQYSKNELMVVQQKNALENAKLTLAQTMNVAYDSAIHLEDISMMTSPKEYPSSIEDIYISAASKLAIVKAADARLASAFKNIQYIKSQRMPSLVLSGGAYTNYSSVATTSTLLSTSDVANGSYALINNEKYPVYESQSTYASHNISFGSQWKNNINTSVVLGLNIPIFNSFQVKNKIKQAKLDQAQADYTSKTLRVQLRQAVERDYFNMKFSFDGFKKLAEQVNEYTTSLKAATIKFENGVLTTVDYILTKNNYDQANMNLVAAKYDYIMRTKILDYYLNDLK